MQHPRNVASFWGHLFLLTFWPEVISDKASRAIQTHCAMLNNNDLRGGGLKQVPCLKPPPLKFPTRKYCWIFMMPLWANWCWLMLKIWGVSLFGKNKKKHVERFFVTSHFPWYISMQNWTTPNNSLAQLWNWSGSSEDYDSCFMLYCSVHLHTSARASGHWALYKWLVNFGVCTIHKSCACAK